MSYRSRKIALLKKVITDVENLQVQNSGLWFHHDLRDNVYYALHIIEAASLQLFESEEQQKNAVNLAEKILLQCISLQDRTKNSDTYGHWPLALDADPISSKPNKLPAELLGSLLVHFYMKHKSDLSTALQAELETALFHLYHSDFYRSDISHYNHHEAKWVSLQLNLGQYFNDHDLLQEGHHRLNTIHQYIKEQGFGEYGSLPWHWHWIQAFTTAIETLTDPSILSSLQSMLDFLWQERGRYYLKGTWIGAHSRSLPHDIPRDANVWFDYLQYGDFSEPNSIPRLEGAGLFDYMIPDHFIKAAALKDNTTEEIKRKILTQRGIELHHYVFKTDHYALGGMWEYTKEFQNEQHRWDITFPLDDVVKTNQAFFFHPGEGNSGKDDLQHQSPYSQVMFHRNVVINTYVLPEDTTNPLITGCLPKGEWINQDNHWFAHINGLYLALYSFQPLNMIKLEDYNRVNGSGLIHGIVMEVWDMSDVKLANVKNLEDFVNKASKQEPLIHLNTTNQQIEITHTSSSGDRISFYSCENKVILRTINSKEVTFEDYKV